MESAAHEPTARKRRLWKPAQAAGEIDLNARTEVLAELLMSVRERLQDTRRRRQGHRGRTHPRAWKPSSAP